MLTKAANSQLYRLTARHAPSLALILARLAARVMFSVGVPKHGVSQLKKNLRVAFKGATDKRLRGFAKQHYAALYEAHVALLRACSMNGEELRDDLRRCLHIEGQERLREIKENKGPVVVITPHYGTFATGLLQLIEAVGESKRVNLFFDDPRTNATTGVFVSLLEKFGGNMRILLNNRKSIFQGFRALQNNEILFLLPDVYDVESRNHIMVPFFGRLSSAMTGTAFFALKANAPIYPMYCYPADGHRCVLEVHPAIKASSYGDMNQDIYALTAEIFQSLENQLRRRPEHWIYWKTLNSRFSSQVELPQDQSGWQANFGALLNEVGQAVPNLMPILTQISAADEVK